MSATPQASLMNSSTPLFPFFRRVSFWALSLEAIIVYFAIETVSNISATPFGSQWYTLMLSFGAIAIILLLQLSRRPLAFSSWLVELITLAVIAGVVENPVRNGLPTIFLAILVWISVEGLRQFLRKTDTVVTVLGNIAILIGAGVLIDGRTFPAISLQATLLIWIFIEFIWIVVDQRYFSRLTFQFPTTKSTTGNP